MSKPSHLLARVALGQRNTVLQAPLNVLYERLNGMWKKCRILKAKKKAQMAATADAARAQSRAASRGHTAGASEHNAISTPQSPGGRETSRGQNKDTGRPITPDLTVDNEGVPLDAGQELRQAVVLLQRLIRGRAVQNVM